jgi:hypothetical protein
MPLAVNVGAANVTAKPWIARRRVNVDCTIAYGSSLLWLPWLKNTGY